MTIKVFSNPDKASAAAARFFVDAAAKSVEERGKFTVALSGGSSPKKTYELLASDPLKNQVPWEDTYIFWGDERFVPPDDPENNARMARKTLLNHIPVPSDHIFAIPTDGKPKKAAEQYSSTLASVFNEKLPTFDFIFLGLGENGHTASLFPETEALTEKSKWADTFYLEDKDQYRITLTAPVINNAKNIIFLTFGDSKAQTLSAVLEGPQKPRQLPAQLINPTNGSLTWYIDEGAAKLLKNKTHP